uniref:Cytochrome c oxidase subunit 7C, mitochondrial n=1 Tax=Culicoides sonorensis TaxID=179676 RepID=A0A336MUE0_CULSO
MLGKQILSRVPQLCGQSFVRRAHDHGGVMGRNLPFGIDNKAKFTVLFTAFLGSGIALPYMVVRHHLTK